MSRYDIGKIEDTLERESGVSKIGLTRDPNKSYGNSVSYLSVAVVVFVVVIAALASIYGPNNDHSPETVPVSLTVSPGLA